VRSWAVGPGGAFVALADIAAVEFAFAAVDVAVANDVVGGFAVRLANARDRGAR